MNLEINQWTQEWAESQMHGFNYQQSCGSTNELAKSEAFSTDLIDEPFKIYVTDEQTSGRGRGQNTWQQGTFGENFISSWSFESDVPLQPYHSPLIGLALYSACKRTWNDIEFNLKAPNDLYIGSKKVAGLLVEIVSLGKSHRVIIGLGLNVKDSPEGLTTATSLIEEGAKINVAVWESFLDRFHFKLNEVMYDTEQEISSQFCNELLSCLNRHPHLEEKYIQVKSDGTLVTATKTISWGDL